MTTETNTKIAWGFSWICQILAAVILGGAAWGKITGAEMAVATFAALGMEPSGRILIGMLEALSAVMLLTNNIPHLGALLGLGVMLGATLAHVSVLGFNVQGDGGETVLLLGAVVISTVAVMYIHRKKLPLVGNILD